MYSIWQKDLFLFAFNYRDTSQPFQFFSQCTDIDSFLEKLFKNLRAGSTFYSLGNNFGNLFSTAVKGNSIKTTDR